MIYSFAIPKNQRSTHSHLVLQLLFTPTSDKKPSLQSADANECNKTLFTEAWASLAQHENPFIGSFGVVGAASLFPIFYYFIN